MIFNPYFIRYFIALPTLINDLIFIFAGTLLIFSFLENKKIYLYIAMFLSAASRINSIFFLIAIILGKFFYKKKFNFSLIDILVVLIIFIAANYLNNYHANTVGLENRGYKHYRVNEFDDDYILKK